jgi:hypothetical protein
MDEDEFIAFMKKKRKTPQTIAVCVENAKEFERFVEEQGKTLHMASTQYLESFIEDRLDKKQVSKFMWTLGYYFEFLGDKDLQKAANEIRSGRIKVSRTPFKLKDFRGVQSKHVAILADLGIEDTAQMLVVGRTPDLRTELAEKSGLDIRVIEEFVKLSDLARIQGLKGIRARLYHDAGFDKLEKLRNITTEELLQITREFVERTGFDGIAPLPKEALSAIETAKKLPEIIEW